MRPTKLIVTVLASLILSIAAFGQADADRNKGIELYRVGQFAESVEILQKLMTSGKADHIAGRYLAAGYVQTGETKQAAEVLKKLKSLKRPATPLDHETAIKILGKPKPNFGEAATRSINSGSITVLVEFKQDGTIGFAFPFAVTSNKLIDGALKAARGVTFEPATIDGKPVNTVNLLEYHFNRY